MKNITYEMKQCPTCKTFSIPADDKCLNCKTQWIYVKTGLWKAVKEAFIGGIIALALFIGFIKITGYFGIYFY